MRSQNYYAITPLALVFAGFLTPDAFADEVERDTETMVVHSTAEEALKQQPGYLSSPLKILPGIPG